MLITHRDTFRGWVDKELSVVSDLSWRKDLLRLDCLEFETNKLGIHTDSGEWFIEDISNKDGVEVYTPIEIAYKMIKMLPIETWSNPDIKVLNPCSKTGVFEYIIYCLFMEGLSDIIDDIDERREHILNNQIYSIAMDKELVKEITFIITGKVTNEYKRVTSIDGYKVEVLNNKELYKNIGVADMNFDIVVGNPPYQRDNGGHVSNTIIQ